MSYRIKIHGRIDGELQRVADEEVATVLRHLESLERGVAATGSIHEARRHLKKLRALVQLLREPLGAKGARAEEAVFREAGRKLQRLRDAQALAATLDALSRRFFDKKRPPIVVAAREVLAAGEDRARRVLAHPQGCAALLASLREARARVSVWSLGEFRWKHLAAALRRSYRRAREAWHHARSASKPRALHDWRRRTKELWCHVTLLHRAAPGFMEELAGELEVLGEFLGDDHDLVVLCKVLAAHPHQVSPGHAREALFEMFALRREELLDAAFDLAQRVFDDTPGEFLRAIEERRAALRRRHKKAHRVAERLAAIG